MAFKKKTQEKILIQKIVVNLYLKKRKTRLSYQKSLQKNSKEFIHRIFVAKNHVEYVEASKTLKDVKKIIYDSKNP